MTDEVALFVCVTCRQDGSDERPGRGLCESLRVALRAREVAGVRIAAVECLSVCKRPCTIALVGARRWTYVFAGLAAADHVDDIVEMAVQYRAAADGVVPWRMRPPVIRRSVISRAPPAEFGDQVEPA